MLVISIMRQKKVHLHCATPLPREVTTNLADHCTDLLDEKKHLSQATLLITAAKDYIAIPDLQISAMKPWVSKLAIEGLDTAHWAQMEAKEKVNELLQNFFERP